jgi:hypothetical protein
VRERMDPKEKREREMKYRQEELSKGGNIT